MYGRGPFLRRGSIQGAFHESPLWRCSPPSGETTPSFASDWGTGEMGYSWKYRYLTEQRERALAYLFDVSKRQPIHDALRTYHYKHWKLEKPLNYLRSKISNFDRDLRNQDLYGGVFEEDGEELEKNHRSVERVIPPVMKGEKGDILTRMNSLLELRHQLENEEREKNEMEERSREEICEEFDEWTEEMVKKNADLREGKIEEEEGNDFEERDPLAHLTSEELNLLAEELYPKTYYQEQMERELFEKILRYRNIHSPRLSYNHIPEEERKLWSSWYLRHLSTHDTTEVV